jgi:hypothetical protein
VLASLTMTACGGTPSPTGRAAATGASTAVAAPAADGRVFEDVYALQKAYVRAGGQCDKGQYWGYVAFASGTIECDHDTMIDVFDDTAAIE